MPIDSPTRLWHLSARMKESSPHEKGLLRVMVWGTSLSFGVLGGIIASMKVFVGGDAAFTFSFKTVLGFLAGFVAGLLFWMAVLRRGRKAR